jgi:tetratricopeptide (TPR) repeat protein
MAGPITRRFKELFAGEEQMPPWARMLFAVIAAAVVFAGIAGQTGAQQGAFLAVAREDHKLVDGRGRTVAEAGRGALLTVLAEERDRYVVQTTAGVKGWAERTKVTPLADAADIYGRLIRAHPSDAAWYALRALVWEQQGEVRKAIGDLDKAIELGHDDPHLYVNRGIFHAAIGEYDKAVADYNAALKGQLDDPVVYLHRAAAYLGQGETEKAIRDCDQVIRREPTRAAAYYQRGVAWRRRNELDKALQDFSSVLKLDPNHLPARTGRGFIHYLQEQSPQAIADFSEVIRRNPQDAVAYNNRGYNRQLMGKYAEALTDYNEAVRLQPEYALAFQNKAWLLATCPEDKIRDGRQAVAAALKVCRLREWKEPSDLKALAAAYAEAGDFDNAVKWQRKVVQSVTGDAQKQEQRILGMYQAGKPFRAARE